MVEVLQTTGSEHETRDALPTILIMLIVSPYLYRKSVLLLQLFERFCFWAVEPTLLRSYTLHKTHFQ
jgi:hypothetical protein